MKGGRERSKKKRGDLMTRHYTKKETGDTSNDPVCEREKSTEIIL